MRGSWFVKMSIPALSVFLLQGCGGSEPVPESSAKAETKPAAESPKVSKSKKTGNAKGNKVADEAYEDAHDKRGGRKSD